ncbi:MAG: serine/threonine protein kinase [Solirubrobacterales bacterium]|nr:serine/threonine protein kinase [Solirubrobacterales bacterium]
MLEAGTIVSGYRVDGVLGDGGMGAVYRATQLSLGRAVALKLLAPNLSDDPGFRARFEREGHVQAALDNDHIVTVYEAGQSDYGLFLAMRLIAGPTLKQLILDASLDPRRSVRLLTQVAHALDTAHGAGLIHRDVKPQNILIGKSDHAYLADFGLIKAPDEARLTGTGQFIGTIDYVAPEQIQAEPATPASDIYALAGVLYECLTGEVPFPKPSDAATLHAHVMQPPPKVSERRPDLPQALDGVIAQGMAKDPWSRPSLAAELIQAASRALSSSPSGIALAAPGRDGAARRERPVQVTKTVASASATPSSSSRSTPSVVAPAAEAVAGEAREPSAQWPRRLIAVIAALILTAFAAGFALGLIVH